LQSENDPTGYNNTSGFGGLKEVPPVECSTGGEVKEKTDKKEGGNYCALSITHIFDLQHPNFWGFLKPISSGRGGKQ
jgi:hypothetical protein